MNIRRVGEKLAKYRMAVLEALARNEDPPVLDGFLGLDDQRQLEKHFPFLHGLLDDLEDHASALSDAWDQFVETTTVCEHLARGYYATDKLEQQQAEIAKDAAQRGDHPGKGDETERTGLAGDGFEPGPEHGE